MELKQTVKRDKEEQLRLRKESTVPAKAPRRRKEVAKRPLARVVEEKEEEIIVNSRGRRIQRPRHFE